MPEVKRQLTEFRGADISQRHREWGWDCPAVDIDFLMVEYDHGEPVCIVEYKHHHISKIDMKHSSVKAIRKLADNSKIPFIYATYWPDIWAFRIYPANDYALNHFSGITDMTEFDYVKWLYKIRTGVFAQQIKEKLHHNDVPKVLVA